VVWGKRRGVGGGGGGGAWGGGGGGGGLTELVGGDAEACADGADAVLLFL